MRSGEDTPASWLFASTLPAARGRIQVTISVGATLAARGDKAQTVLRRADRLMYQSKTVGRNRMSMRLAT